MVGIATGGPAVAADSSCAHAAVMCMHASSHQSITDHRSRPPSGKEKRPRCKCSRRELGAEGVYGGALVRVGRALLEREEVARGRLVKAGRGRHDESNGQLFIHRDAHWT